MNEYIGKLLCKLGKHDWETYTYCDTNLDDPNYEINLKEKVTIKKQCLRCLKEKKPKLGF